MVVVVGVTRWSVALPLAAGSCFETGCVLFGPFDSAVVGPQFFLAYNFLVPPLTRTNWPGFKALSSWKKAKWVNLSVSLAHSSLSCAVTVVAVAAVWDEFVGTEDWTRVRQWQALLATR